MKIERRYTTADRPVVDQIEWKTVEASIPGKGFAMMVEVPTGWDDDAINIFADKYLRKGGVPDKTQLLCYNTYPHMPRWLKMSRAAPEATIGTETSAKQVFHRMAGAWTYWGWRVGIFWYDSGELDVSIEGRKLRQSDEYAHAFYDECFMMLALQVAAPNSPQWFNTGLHWAYGIEGPNTGQWFCDDQGVAHRTTNSYERPQPHACFLTSIDDDLVGEGGIMDAWTREARIFKHGSGSGINPSRLRAKGEKLSGGGVASGLISFLEVGDRSAGAIQSGGVTRRAAKMVCLDDDHPEIEAFIDWKVREETKAAAMEVGSKYIRDNAALDPSAYDIPIRQAVIDRVVNGFVTEVFDCDWEGEAIRTVSAQNENHSIRVTDAFLAAVDADTDWELTARTDGHTMKRVEARALWDRICRSAWACGDPGVIFHDTVNAWATCSNDGEIRTTNPCCEFHHIDGSACNLASLRLTAFALPDGSINLPLFEHVCRLLTIILDISVSMASFPSREFAEGAWQYRTLGLGYADAGALLMRLGLPYDSDEGRALIAALTALMTGVAYRTSAELAAELGPFPQWEPNEGPMQQVLRNHARAAGASKVGLANFEHLNVYPYEVNRDNWDAIWSAAQDAWERVLAAKSFRNAQATLLAPTGTISFVMGCDTTGIEPEFALVKHKSLAGGGTMQLVNGTVSDALANLGYTSADIARAVKYILEHGSLESCFGIKDEHLSVFDCSNPAREGGRFIAPMAHVKMVAAVQPFLSGAVSKTMNLPHTATVVDIDQLYREAHRLGVKAVAPYRDRSKLSQPLTVTGIWDDAKHVEQKLMPNGRTALTRGERERLPGEVSARRFKARVDDRAVYVITGEYSDGRLGEVFLEIGREGSDVRAWANCFAKMVSIGLQYGVPPHELVDAFEFVRFDPSGPVQGHDRVKMCASIPDLVARILGVAYLKRDDLAHLPAVDVEAVLEIAEVIGDRPLGSRRAVDRSCPNCHNDSLERTGTCVTCRRCGYNEGCA